MRSPLPGVEESKSNHENTKANSFRVFVVFRAFVIGFVHLPRSAGARTRPTAPASAKSVSR